MYNLKENAIESNRSASIPIDLPSNREREPPLNLLGSPRARQPWTNGEETMSGRRKRGGGSSRWYSSHVYTWGKKADYGREGRRWLQIPRRQPRRTLFDSLSKLRHLLLPLCLATRNPLWSFRSSAHVYTMYTYTRKFLLENEKFSEYLRAREPLVYARCVCVCSVMCNQSVYTHCVTGHVDIKPEGTKTIRFLLRLHW